MSGGCQDAVYGFENLACQGQDSDWIEGIGHGLPVLRVPLPQLMQQLLFNGYRPPLRGTGIRADPLFLLTAN